MAQFVRRGVFGAAILAVLAAAAFFFLRPKPAALGDRAEATRLLGDYLKKTFQPRAVLVIGNPFAQLPNRPAQVYAFENAGVEGLKSALGESVSLISAAPRLKPEVIENPASAPIDPKSPTPLSFIVESSAFDELIKSHPECSVVVSLIGLPVTLSQFEAWTKPGAPHFALLLPDWRIIGDDAAIRSAFASGKLGAAVIERPGPGSRYLLVESNNFTSVSQQFPQLFPP
jgi:hypothetical protein